MLDELYFAADAHLAGAKDRAFDDARLAERPRAAREVWSGDRRVPRCASSTRCPSATCWRTAPRPSRPMPGSRSTAATTPVHAAVVPSRHPEFAEVCVVAEDRPGLPRADRRRPSPPDASRFLPRRSTRARVGERQVGGRDLFWVRDRTEGPEAVERAMPRLVRDLVDVCSGTMDPESSSASAPARRLRGASDGAPRC